MEDPGQEKPRKSDQKNRRRPKSSDHHSIFDQPVNYTPMNLIIPGERHTQYSFLLLIPFWRFPFFLLLQENWRATAPFKDVQKSVGNNWPACLKSPKKLTQSARVASATILSSRDMYEDSYTRFSTT